jgi:hypothetical protein
MMYDAAKSAPRYNKICKAAIIGAEKLEEVFQNIFARK